MASPYPGKNNKKNVFYVPKMVDHILPTQLTSAYTMDIGLYPLVLCTENLPYTNFLDVLDTIWARFGLGPGFDPRHGLKWGSW